MARSKVVDVVEEAAEGVKLEDARVVVSGGRGLGGPEPFAALETLANLLGGAVGASRAAVDSGWVPSSYQVGLTGKTITPEVYITIAISGPASTWRVAREPRLSSRLIKTWNPTSSKKPVTALLEIGNR